MTTFNANKRACLGKEMAMLEMKILLIELVGQFKFEISEEF
eukprot:CAMPEP_0116938418 /NCGR_PEP_ID=MMETSP0467-20121206/32113_1 /TAXON_ID=283647 /ORGANISM="Mesodinium pulex, Strain SPMC105" /LENGTH=40 /DNA_ID= /DNA_START= /DNA_END= /DNA_ORIENTATION=